MEVNRDYRRVLNLEMMADDEKGYDEITPFISAMKKIEEDSSTIGFVNRFTPNERMVLRGIWENIKNNAQAVIETNYKEVSKGVQSPGVQDQGHNQ